MARCLEMCGHPTLTTKWIDFSFKKPKASTHPALTPGLIEPCFYAGAFFFLLFLIFFFHLKFFFFFFFLPFPVFPFDFLFFSFFSFFSFVFLLWWLLFLFGFVFAVDFFGTFLPPLHLIFPTPKMSLRMLQKVGAWSRNRNGGRELTVMQPGWVGLEGTWAERSPVLWI